MIDAWRENEALVSSNYGSRKRIIIAIAHHNINNNTKPQHRSAMVNFPHQRSRLAYNQQSPVVKFADTARIYMVERHEDSQKYNVTRHELWYTESEYYMMKLEFDEDALKEEVRSRDSPGDPYIFSYNDDKDPEQEESDIERLMSRANMLRERARKARRNHAFLTEKARQGTTEIDIALASFKQTGRRNEGM